MTLYNSQDLLVNNGAQDINDIEKDLIESEQQLRLKQFRIDHSTDRPLSILYFITGIFSFIPLFVNFNYLRSPDRLARIFAHISLFLASFYFVLFIIVLFTSINNLYGLYDFNRVNRDLIMDLNASLGEFISDYGFNHPKQLNK